MNQPNRFIVPQLAIQQMLHNLFTSQATNQNARKSLFTKEIILGDLNILL